MLSRSQPGGQLDEGDDVDSPLRRPAQGTDDGPLGCRAVERVLHGQYLGIVGGSHHEGVDRAGRRVVGRVHEQIAVLDHGEGVRTVAAHRRQPGGWRRRRRGRLEPGKVEVAQLAEAGQAEQAVDHVDVLLGQVQVAHQPGQEIVGNRRLHLQADGGPRPVPAQLELGRGQQILRGRIGGQTGLAGDPEQGMRRHPEGPEQRVEVGHHELLDRHRPAVGQAHEAGHDRGQLDGTEPVTALVVAQADGDVDGQVSGRRRRPARLGDERGQRREDALAEQVLQVGPVPGAERPPLARAQAMGGKSGPELAQDPALPLQHLLHPEPHRPLLPASGRRSPALGAAQLEHLVEAAGGGGQHPDPLQRFDGLVLGERQNPGARFHPGDVLVEVPRHSFAHQGRLSQSV